MYPFKRVKHLSGTDLGRFGGSRYLEVNIYFVSSVTFFSCSVSTKLHAVIQKDS